MDLTVRLAGIRLDHPLMNAAGTCRTVEEARKLILAPTAAVMIGSITVQPRPGNSGEVFWPTEDFSLNSMGMPNPGINYYRQHLPEIIALANRVNKPVFVSVAGFSPSEYVALTAQAFSPGAALVELNLSCPNVWEAGQQEKIACFDPSYTARILRTVEGQVGPRASIAVKLSPFSDPAMLSTMAKVIGDSKLVKVVTTSNTFPNALSLDEQGKPRIATGDGLAGLAGKALRPIALGQIKQLRQLLPERIQLVGVGGITKAQDILDFQRAGATAVQIATDYFVRGERAFVSLLEGLIKLSPD
jgi:dihydroorotate dehydrogenase (fumarate)